MSQASPTIGTGKTHNEYRSLDNDGKQALLNHHKGSTAPSYKEAGTLWLDDSATPWLMKFYDGADWITVGAFNSTTNAVTPYQGTSALRYVNYAADTGSANAYVIAPTPAISAYAAGMIFTLKPGNENTGSSTLAASSLSAITLKTPQGDNLPAKYLLTTQVYIIYYDGTNGIVLNGRAQVEECIAIPVGVQNATITAGTSKFTFRMPWALAVTKVKAGCKTAPTGANIVIDINENGVSILSTKLSIDATEKTSETAATPAVISDTALGDDSEITIDFDQVGSTVAGTGVIVYIYGKRAPA